MRRAFAKSIVDMFSEPPYFFLTGDLGFMALEGVKEAMQERFVNMGVSEQNMISVAAGLAKEGCPTFTYSIAPFCYARPFEQIRNDVCFSQLPVYIVGNGGGYAYGYMGPTHHALEDCSAMLSLPGMRVFVPAFNEDVFCILKKITEIGGPAYLRLGYDVRKCLPACLPAYAGCRLLLSGKKGVMLSLGPMAGVCWSAILPLPESERPALYAITELPIENLPKDLLENIQSQGLLFVVEEHVRAGGLGMNALYHLASCGVIVKHFYHRYALGYPSGRYGSQNFHRAECAMDIAGIQELINQAS